jgi:hypothetical protein
MFLACNPDQNASEADAIRSLADVLDKVVSERWCRTRHKYDHHRTEGLRNHYLRAQHHQWQPGTTARTLIYRLRVGVVQILLHWARGKRQTAFFRLVFVFSEVTCYPSVHPVLTSFRECARSICRYHCSHLRWHRHHRARKRRWEAAVIDQYHLFNRTETLQPRRTRTTGSHSQGRGRRESDDSCAFPSPSRLGRHVPRCRLRHVRTMHRQRQRQHVEPVGYFK